MENESNRIKIPSTSLSLEIVRILQDEHGIEPKKSAMGCLELSFTPEELGLITKLKITNPAEGDLRGIELLPNLEVLEIESSIDPDFTHPKDVCSIDDRDVDEIAKCKSLKSLSVVNQNNITWLNVLGLNQLNQLVVTNNKNLEQIYGLDTIPDLWVLKCYGNNLLYEIKNLEQIILGTDETHLDVLLFPNAIGYNHITGEYNETAVKRILEQGNYRQNSWREGLPNNRFIPITSYQMIQMHNKACEILDSNVSEYASDRDVVVGIENYMARNISYDKKALRHSRTHTVDIDSETKMQVGPKNGINGAYNAIMFGTSVCEGYTRAMQYMLKLKGIKSHNVYCFGEKDNTGTSHLKIKISPYHSFIFPKDGGHSIICIDDIDYLYDDPCWNACLYQKGDHSMPYILNTKDEISETHTLSFNERFFDSRVKMPRRIIEESIRSNRLFIENRARTSDVMRTRDRAHKRAKGVILEKGQDI